MICGAGLFSSGVYTCKSIVNYLRHGKFHMYLYRVLPASVFVSAVCDPAPPGTVMREPREVDFGFWSILPVMILEDSAETPTWAVLGIVFRICLDL